MDGLVLIDKPRGISSFDVIRQLRRITGFQKIGHAGTLDPLATGLMLMLFGPGCKQAQSLSGLDKWYETSIALGQTSTTGDEEGEKQTVSSLVPSQTAVEAAIDRFKGTITQTPSPYSAIKINGREAYKRVRAGETVVMPSRQVEVFALELVSYIYPVLKLRAHVSSGTYIRSLAEDIGLALTTGGYVSELRRTAIGPYVLADSLVLDQADRQSVEAALVKLV
jgi:tRNA pseudouridine55 synthase